MWWFLVFLVGSQTAGAFVPLPLQQEPARTLRSGSTHQGLLLMKATNENDGNNPSKQDATTTASLSYEETDIATKGLVSSLTNVFNSLAPTKRTSDNESLQRDDGQDTTNIVALSSAPTSPRELMKRIQADYEENNYLWTGNVDLACFDEHCKFQDPTLSFVGQTQFVENVQNLQPVVDALVTQEQSILLDIQLNEDEGYVQTRWKMVGDFSGLFWKPRLDVIGRTKFWYQTNQDNNDDERNDAKGAKKTGDRGSVGYSVYFYDEEWEIPAYRALLQLFTPTIFSSSSSSK